MQKKQISDQVRNRLAVIIFIAQGFFSASTIAAFTLSPIIVTAMAGEQAAGFPSMFGLVGRAAFAYPFGYLMDRLGRRLALAGGYSLAIVGAAASIYAVINNSYLWFLIGALLIGMSRSASDQSRYIAAEIFPIERRASIISWIVFAGTIGAIFGPRMVEPSARIMNRFGIEGTIATNSGPFAAAGLAVFIGSLLTFLFLRPDPLELGRQVAKKEAEEDADSIENLKEERSITTIFSQPLVQLSVVAMTLGYFVMSFLMTITPVHMANNGHEPGAIANVIMAHTLGMFGLSWLTGRLVKQFGQVPMIYAGSGILILSAIISPISTEVPVLALALFLLGLGWNFAFVAGSSLLSNALTSYERARGQTAAETLVALTTGLSGLTVGTVYGISGYIGNSIVGGALSLLLLLLTVWFTQRDQAHKNG